MSRRADKRSNPLAGEVADVSAAIEDARKKGISKLDLSGHGLARLPASIGELAKLQSLNISRNRLTRLPASIRKLTQLQNLYISDNQLKEVPESVAQLAQLQNLDISRNQLKRLPASIGKLTHLESLYVSDNLLTELPESVGQLSQLQGLGLFNNGLHGLPKSMGHLTQLRILDLTNNELTAVPASFKELAQLEALYLDDNRLTALHESLRSLNSLKKLYLHGNDALGLPAEVLGPSWRDHGVTPANPATVLEYYFRAYGGRRPLNEAKLILVGRGAVGKTSLVNRLVHNRFEPWERKTEGIQITAWPLRLNDTENIRLNVWDFGGQEIMHATHQLFFTRRSLYLLVINGREGTEDADAEYWLRLIESFGDQSPVIVVLNKIKDHPFDVNRRALQQKYPAIREFIKTDCADETGLEQLRQAIERETDRLEHLRDAFPASWFSIKDRLARMQRNYLSFDDYRALCAELGETNTLAQESLAFYLHSLGIALNFRDDPRLQETHVLNPHWVTNGIYKILNSERLEQQKGEIQLDELSTILDLKKYPAVMYRFIFDLMKKFELCFSFPDDDTRYLIPELLDKQEPAATAEFTPEECLNFQYHYPILPEGLLPRFIVRTHVLSEGFSRWRTGVILKFEGNQALVKADAQDRRVFISVSGSPLGRRRLLGIIRSDFERIHHDLRNLQPQEMVPLPEHPEVVTPYQELLLMEQNGVRKFPKLVGNQVAELDVYELLNGIDLEGTRRSEKSIDEHRQEIRLFYSYAHKDERLRNELETHLKLLQRRGLVDSWHDRRIDPGSDWKGEIDENLEHADIILFLLSADFLASDYCYEKEVGRAIERHASGKARLIPVVLRDVSWASTPFGHLQALPKDGLAVTRWPNRDSAWRSVAEGLERIIGQRLEGSEEVAEALFVAAITLKNIRCFENLQLSFLSEEIARNFILLFGDNGVGKTTLLRSIALGICDETIATALMEMLPGPLLREKTDEGVIRIDLADPAGRNKWTIETILRRTQEGLVTIEQNIPANFPRDQVFACGYGAGRLRFGTQDYAGYSLKNSLGTLFDYGINLQNPELAFSRIERAQRTSLNELTQRIDAVLMLEPGSTTIDSFGIRIKGPWGDFTPLGGLGDGFQATLGWIADLFGWGFSYEPDSILNGISGIVLLDELEQHLHPSWQREIIKLLHQQFPRIQFIGTSHAPMCALGTTALSESVTEIVGLRQINGSVEATSFALPKGQRADQVLTSPVFGLFSASGFDVSADIERYAQLASRRARSDAESVEFIELGEHLTGILGPFRNDLDRRIDELVREAMHRELEDVLKSGKLTNEVLDFQIRNRINAFHSKSGTE